MKINYRIVLYNHWEDLEIEVNDLLKHGWELHGPTKRYPLGHEAIWVQPMIHREMSDTEYFRNNEIDVVYTEK